LNFCVSGSEFEFSITLIEDVRQLMTSHSPLTIHYSVLTTDY